MAGGSSSRGDEGKKKARIEIIPLIDVIFFLLATFVLFTLSLDRTVSVPVTLPKTVVNPGPPDETMLSVQMSAGNTAFLKLGAHGASEPIDIGVDGGALEERLRAYKGQYGANAKVLVSADSSAKFGATVLALDKVRKVGIDQVSIQTTTNNSGH